MLGRLAVMIAATHLVVAVAHADVRRTVHLETTPPGATVYIGDKDGEPAGTTPIDLKLAPGDYVLVVELDGYLDAVVQAQVSGRNARQPIELDPILMQAAESTLVIKGEAPAGAVVIVDGEPHGRLPQTLAVSPGPHQIQVMLDDRAIWDEWVEIDSGAEHLVTVTPVPEVPVPSDDGPRGPRPPVAIARVGPDFGWRALSYDAPGDAMFTPSFASRGLAAIRIEAELAPWRLEPRAHTI